MTYTFLHRGFVMGTSDLLKASDRRSERVGIFQPTQYGLHLMPTVTRIFSASHALRSQLEASKLSIENLTPEEADQVFNSEAGRAMLEVGRVLCEVAVQSPNGEFIEFSSIAFSDVDEIRRMTTALNLKSDIPAVLPPEAPRYIVSLTLGRAAGWSESRFASPQSRGGRVVH